MNKRIFVINGSGGVGKDTFVNMVSKYIPTTNYSSVDKIKEAAKVIGWNGEKTEKARKFLSDLKILSTEYNNYPYKSMINKINDFLEDTVNQFLFLHIREPEEIKCLSKEFDLTTILISNSNVSPINTNMADKNVFDYDYDMEITNDSDLTKLNEKAELFCELYGDMNEA